MVKSYDTAWHDALRLGSAALLAVFAIALWLLQLDYLKYQGGIAIVPQGLLGWAFIALTVATVVRHGTLVVLGTIDKFRPLPPVPAATAPNLPSVSVLVPAFNEGVTIGDTLASLLRLDYPNLEIIVIDDGSPDETFARAHALQEAANRAGKRLLLVTQPNAGKAEALNFGIARAGGELILCIDADGIVASDALLRAVRHFEDPLVGGVSGSVHVFNRDTLLTRMQALEYLNGLALPKAAQSFGDAVLLVPGPLGLFRKSALRSVGGYDSDTFAEDFDLTLKLLGAGWRVRYDRTVRCATECPSRVMDLIRQRYRWSRGAFQVLRKRRQGWRQWRQRPFSIGGSWLLTFESLLLPALNIFGQISFVIGGLLNGVHESLLLWWLQWVLLDTAVAAYCLQAEAEEPSLLMAAPFQRLFYTTFVDMTTLLSVFDELRGLKMNWGVLPRAGGLR